MFLAGVAELLAVVAFFLLCLAAAVGLVLIIAGIIKKRKPKYSGNGSPAVFITAGSAFLAASAVILLIGSLSSTLADGLIEKLNAPKYDNITDGWRNSRWTSDSYAAYEAKTALLAAADSGDREGVAQLFTPNIRKRKTFDSEIDEFMRLYPVGLSECEHDGGMTSAGGSQIDGERVGTGSAFYTAELDGEHYFIRLEYCYENTASPDDVGITFFAIENLEANALGEDYELYDYLVCRFSNEEDVIARFISGYGYIFEPYYHREITEESFREQLKGCDTIKDLIDRVGRPNVKKNTGITGADFFYELVPENGEPRYAFICTDRGEFCYGWICSDREMLYDRPLFDEDE